MHRILQCATLATLFYLAQAVSIGYNFNSQLPPVARINEPYYFVLSRQTFSDVDGSLSVYIENVPDWLSFDNSSWAFSGTPDTAVANEAVELSLIASDNTGIANDTAVLIVSDDSTPRVSIPMSKQLGMIGSIDGKGGIILLGNSDFNLSFDRDTFTAEDGGPLEYWYGVSADFSPLPPWINFDPSTRTFYGQTPNLVSEIAPPTEYQFQLVGSDYKGFRGSYASWHIAVGTHSLTINQTYWSLNASTTEPISFTLPKGAVQLDGNPISTSNVSQVKSNASDWLSFDSQSWTLSGQPQQSSKSQTVIVEIEDVFSDRIQANIEIEVITGLFTSNISSINATIGDYFSYTVNSTYLVDPDARLSANFDADWLHYNQDNRTFSGFPPNSPDSLRVDLTAASTSLGRSESESFSIDVVRPKTHTTPSSTTSPMSSQTHQPTSASTGETSGPSSTKTPESSAQAAKSHHGLSQSQKLAIGLGVTLPLLAILAIVLLCCCCVRRRRYQESARSDSPRNAGHAPISRPMQNNAAGWPIEDDSWDTPRRLSALQIFKEKSKESGLSGYVAEFHQDANGRFQRSNSSQNRGNLNIDTALANRDGQRDQTRPWRRPTSSSDEWEHDLRASDASLATVATNEIFSVRLVSPRSPEYTHPQSPVVEVTPPQGNRNDDYSDGSIGSYTSSSSENRRAQDGSTQSHGMISSESRAHTLAPTASLGTREDSNDWVSEPVSDNASYSFMEGDEQDREIFRKSASPENGYTSSNDRTTADNFQLGDVPLSHQRQTQQVSDRSSRPFSGASSHYPTTIASSRVASRPTYSMPRNRSDRSQTSSETDMRTESSGEAAFV